MTSLAKKEGIVLLLLIAVLVIGLYPALRHARRETRDGIRRDEIAARKTALEQYFNAHDTYPLTFDASPHQYVVEAWDSAGAISWFVRARLENESPETVAFDAEAGRNYWYRIVRYDSATYYDVCGGIARCGATDAQLEARE